ncbi:tetratricopeptide repeat protein [Variovorax sp. OV329]|uniref:tetratricopeptide repeat protein n=1 Tax=Variovorax sp. OV329 TaxID=1882825 RepID=UPI0008ED0033|nr:tetratricopeptide repeat protein [Variovorax sp. OV329]SFN10321.1 Tetratricopeptide repeat-containing protein [Variovorax sp. OV329]
MADSPSLDSTHPYTLRGVTQMLGLTRHAVGRLIELGFVQPVRSGRSLRFSFRDVVLMRTAQELRAADIPTRQILRSLRQLKSALPLDTPASAIRIRAVGDRVAVRWGDAQWDADTGQLMMDFHAALPAAAVHAIDGKATAPCATAEPPPDIQSLYEQAESLEGGEPKKAEALYRRVIEAAPDHVDAYANLGFMMCESGRFAEAAALYALALRHCPQAPLLHYNRGVALESLGHEKEAVQSYEACLRLAPDMADAHQNAALLYARAGDKQRAIRHFSAYRRLQPRG